MTTTRRTGVQLVRGPFVRLQPNERHCETAADLAALAVRSRKTTLQRCWPRTCSQVPAGLAWGWSRPAIESSSARTMTPRRWRPTATTSPAWRLTGTWRRRHRRAGRRAYPRQPDRRARRRPAVPAVLQSGPLGDAAPVRARPPRPARPRGATCGGPSSRSPGWRSRGP